MSSVSGYSPSFISAAATSFSPAFVSAVNSPIKVLSHTSNDFSSAYLSASIVDNQNSSESIEKQKLARSNDNKDKAKKLVEKVLECSATKKLYEQACSTVTDGNRTGPWEIKFARYFGPSLNPDFNYFVYEDSTIIVAPAYKNHDGGDMCDHKERTISLNEENSEWEILSTFIFELTNATKASKAKEFDSKAIRGEMSCEDFVEAIEMTELEGVVMHHQVVQEGIDKHGWDKSVDVYWANFLDKYLNKSNNVKDFFKDVFDENDRIFWPHSDYYRHAWERLTNKKSEILACKTLAEKKAVYRELKPTLAKTTESSCCCIQ